ncbi:MAG: hypothetical protein E7650_01055 [Ruminococcaceae bacterium]|nr:hypothetical protein [Oscillospiraceae bacterium]MBE6706221.1 hypothetical protein [Oscillospiraceae bacterium]
MARVRDMQGCPAHLVTLKSDGKRRHPSRCIFAVGKAPNRYCTNEQSPVWKDKCSSAAKCDFYEEGDVKNG